MTRPRGEQQGGGRLTVIALLVVLVLALGALGYGLTHQIGPPPEAPLASSAPTDAGPSSTASASTTASPTTVPAETTGSPAASRPVTAQAPATAQPASASQPASLQRSEPISVEIPSIRVRSEVFPLGINPDGALGVPSGNRADDVAWFRDSPTPGETGPAVLEGHVTYGDARSVFFDLGAVRPGATVIVQRADGSRAVFDVYRVSRFPKTAFPTQLVYGNTTGPELRVITCGGDVDGSGHHLDNTIVFARLHR